MSKFEEHNDRIKKLYGLGITDFTWHNIKYDPKVRLFLGVLIVFASFCALVVDNQFSPSTNKTEAIGKLVGFGIGISVGIWFIVKRDRKPPKNSGDKVIDNLD